MKKFGFTLAETLIAMAIVGVIASITIPTIVKENQKKVWANSLATAVGDFENAMTTYLITENANCLTETEAWKDENKDDISEALKDRITLKKVGDNWQDYYKILKPLYQKTNADAKLIVNMNFREYNNFSSGAFAGIPYETKKNITYFIQVQKPNVKIPKGNIQRLQKVVARVMIDIIAKKEPNRIGRDVFFYILGHDGYLFPYQSLGITDSYMGGCETETWSMGVTCAARLAANGYKMDY